MKNKIIIIAEVGINHNGSILNAKKLINLAKRAGADYVKFQSYKSNNLVCENFNISNYQLRNIKKRITQFDLLKKYELNENQHKEIIRYCKKKKIRFLSSPFDTDSLSLLYSLNIFDIKIPSGEINNYILLKKIAQRAKKIFLSTGMSKINEIGQAIKILINNGALKKNITVLHCHSDYPTNLSDVNLLAMLTIASRFKVRIGYSDHTLGKETGIAAAALGAQVLEKHITLSKNMRGPDHKASMNPKQFIDYVSSIRKTENLLGSYIKKPSKSEILNKRFTRKSIVAKVNIKKGELFSESNIISKRPEGGVSPLLWNNFINKKAKKNFLKDQFIFLK
jgi:N,N'-diacetyllegionaminate synthase